MIRRIFVRLLLSLAVISGTCANAAELADTIAKIRGGIVAVGTYQATRRPPNEFHGTGFAIGDGKHIITNAHVLPTTLKTDQKEILAVFVGDELNAEIRPAAIIDMDTEHDLALLKIDGKPLPPLRIGDSQRVREGEAIAFTGFPIGMVLGLYPVTHQGIVSAITPIAIPAVSSRWLDAATIKRLGKPYKVLQLDATAYPGNSGSPVYKPATGRVIGVINKVFVKESKENLLTQPSGITYAIPSRYISELLNRNGTLKRSR